MATIEDISGDGATALVEELRMMTDEQLLAQDLVQQGAVHALSTLLKSGCTEAMATDMLQSLRGNAKRIRDEAARRGKQELFEGDQTGFN